MEVFYYFQNLAVGQDNGRGLMMQFTLVYFFFKDENEWFQFVPIIKSNSMRGNFLDYRETRKTNQKKSITSRKGIFIRNIDDREEPQTLKSDIPI